MRLLEDSMISSKESPPIEIVDDPPSVGNQGFQRWQYPFAVTTSGLLKQYAEARLNAHVHFRMSTHRGRRSEDLCALFLPIPRFCWTQDGLDPVGDCFLNVGDVWFYDDDHAVFVDVVEFMNTPERIGLSVGWPSFVWLQRFDRSRCFGPDPREPFRHVLGVLGGICQANGEVTVSACHRVASRNSKLTNQMVEGTTQVVHRVSDQERNLWWEWCSLRDDRQVFPFRLVFDGRSPNGISRG